MTRITFILAAAALGCTFAEAQNTKELNAVYFAEPVFEQVSFGSGDAQLLKMETPEGGVVFDAKEFAQALTPVQEEAIGEQFEMKAILDASTPIQEEAISEQFEMKAILDAATPIQEEAISEQFEMKAILDAATQTQEEAISDRFNTRSSKRHAGSCNHHSQPRVVNIRLQQQCNHLPI